MKLLGVGIYVKNSPQAVEMYKSAFGLELGYTFQTRNDLEHAFSVLKAEGTVELDICELPWSPCAAIVTDCFGVTWYLTLPQHKPSDDGTPETDS